MNLVKKVAASRPRCGMFCAKLICENVKLPRRDNPTCCTDDYTIAETKASILSLWFLTCLHASCPSFWQSHQSFSDHYWVTPWHLAPPLAWEVALWVVQVVLFSGHMLGVTCTSCFTASCRCIPPPISVQPHQHVVNGLKHNCLVTTINALIRIVHRKMNSPSSCSEPVSLFCWT